MSVLAPIAAAMGAALLGRSEDERHEESFVERLALLLLVLALITAA